MSRTETAIQRNITAHFLIQMTSNKHRDIPQDYKVRPRPVLQSTLHLKDINYLYLYNYLNLTFCFRIISSAQTNNKIRFQKI